MNIRWLKFGILWHVLLLMNILQSAHRPPSSRCLLAARIYKIDQTAPQRMLARCSSRLLQDPRAHTYSITAHLTIACWAAVAAEAAEAACMVIPAVITIAAYQHSCQLNIE